ncbi:hypothetical protein G7Z17_g2363 [Cylindrodendrum hubeiense]|uniref:Uncharacterized protein n=1 Tax=Cylindrodendrum hubeiense TaxID=595255 RepID=A0A9P5LKD5_9HYPO|nr:hypothetical protein G7Z17_g2363 [Cylindrodendrum hubeiense]
MAASPKESAPIKAIASNTTTFFTDLPALSSKITNFMTTTKKPLSEAINNAVRSGGLDLESTNRLLFFHDLTTDDGLRCFFAEKYGNAKPVLAQIALAHYHNDLTAFNSKAVIALQATFWEREPPAVLLATLRKTKLLTTTLSELRPHVERALELALDKGLTLESPEFGALIQSPDFMPAAASPAASKKGGEVARNVTADEVYKVMVALQRLHCIVTDPTHIDVLIKSRMLSAHSIAVMSRGVFISSIKETYTSDKTLAQISDDAAARIHDHAVTIDCRNQETWAKILDGLKSDFVMIDRVVVTEAEKKKAQEKEEDEAARTVEEKRNLAEKRKKEAEEKRKQDEEEKTQKEADERKKKADEEKKKQVEEEQRKLAEKDKEAGKSIVVSEPQPPRRDVLAHMNYNMSTIFDLQSSPCEECCSVTGPAAYFVDLLNFLEASRYSSANGGSHSLFEALMHRRPDLKHLKLSCANSKNMLPYISIVNEVLESFINSAEDGSSSGEAVEVVNETEEKAVADASPLQNREVSAFGKMESLMFPLDVFPFNQGLSAIELYLSAVGMTPFDVLTTFRSEARILASYRDALPEDKLSREDLLKEAEIVYRRAATAESLNLRPMDVAAITQETIYTPRLMRKIMALRPKGGELLLRGLEAPETCENWGYEDEMEMTDTSEFNGTGLCFIRSQFMPRSGLSFEELLELLSSRYFGTRLVITNADKKKAFTGQISEMRLQSLNLAAEGPAKTTVGPLKEQICHEIQAFIRLKNRLGWTISRLDTTLSALLENHVATGVARNIDSSLGISFRLLEDLSCTKKLADLVDMPIEDILPLWAPIGTHGKNSLFERVFLGAATVLSGDPIFASLKLPKKPIKDHIPALMAALRRTQDELGSVMRAADIKDTNVDITMDVLTKLYRHSTMCRMLKATPTEYLEIRSLLPAGVDLFRDPQTTMSHIEGWVKLAECGWSKEDIVATINPPPPAASTLNLNTKSIINALSLTASIVAELDALNKFWESRIGDKTVRPEDIVQVCGELYDATTTAAVTAFIEGTQKMEKSIPLSSPVATFLQGIKKLPPNLTLSVSLGSKAGGGSVLLTLTGVLSPDSRNLLLEEEKSKDVLGELTVLLDELRTLSSSAWNPVSERLFAALDKEEQDDLAEQFEEDVRDGTRDFEHDKQAYEVEMTLKARRLEFISAALPTLRKQLVQRAVVRAIGEAMPGLEPPVLSMLTTMPLGNSETAAAEAIQQVCSGFATNGATDEEMQDVFFRPVASDTYQFQLLSEKIVEKSGVEQGVGAKDTPNEGGPTLAINGVNLPLTRTAADDGWQSAPIMLTTSQPYALSASVSLKTARWLTKQSSQPIEFSTSALMPVNIISSVSHQLVTVGRFAQLVQKLGLGLEEFKYLSSSAVTPVKVDLNSPGIRGLCALEMYRSVRDSVADDGDALVALFAWLCSPATNDNSSLASRLAKATIWPEVQLATVLELKYPGLKEREIIDRFASSLDELVALQAIMESSARLSAAPGQQVAQPLLILFQIATPTPPMDKRKDLNTASSLQLCLGPGQLAQCNRDVRENQRTALVQFLLRQDYIQNLGIGDPDGLFAHFMLDVQMGGQLEITRIKAAISTVQLFVQRVLLGKEVSAGVLDAKVDKKKWAWMQRHNIWQATRKAFLYPENWIDPSLRDDKTPLFDAYETAVMSKDLSWDTFSQAIKGYVQSLQGIADLDITAYLRELRPGDVEIYHFFGRTRSAPFDFYYRTMRILRSGSGKDLVFWSSWSKIGVEAPAYEADWDGKTLDKGGCYLVPVVRNNRLFLYLPQLMAKSQAAKPQDAKTDKELQDISKEKLKATAGPCKWEIRMSWTELVDGQWTPKRLSQTPLIVEWRDVVDNLPSVDKFIFNAETTGPNVIIRVGCRRSQDGSYYSLGHFDINDERVVTTSGKEQNKSLGTAMNTSFHKYSWKSASNVKVDEADKTTIGALGELVTPTVVTYSVGKNADEAPLLAIPSRDHERTLTWTLSYANSTNNANKPTGLVADEQRGGADGTTIFLYPKDEKLKEGLGSNLLYKSSSEEIIEHSASRELMEAVCKSSDGVGELFKVMDSKLVKNHDYGKTLVRADMSAYHELTTSYAVYNWELGLHAILLAVDRFHTTQQFELALKAARFVFDPTVTPPAKCSAAEAGAACWRFRPFRDIAMDKSAMADKFSGWPLDGTLEMAVSERRSNPSSAHSTARGRPQAYMKWIVMKYIEILIAAGDEYFRQGSMETLPLAIQRYVEAAHVLGPDPPRVPRLAKAVVKTFAELGSSHTTLDLELAFPFICEVARRGSARAKGGEPGLLCILTTTYFSLPPNPKYAGLRTLVQDRLYKARNNLDINGRPIIYSMSEPFIDPGQLMRAMSAGGAAGLGSLMNDADSPMPYQRFSFLINKALELCNELRSMGDQYLLAREKQDSEALSLLKARQDTTRQEMMLDVRALQGDEITKTIESLVQNREAAVAQLQYYLRLTGDSLDLVPATEGQTWEDIAQNISKPISDHLRMSPYETAELVAAGVASTLNLAAAGMDTFAGFMKALPNVAANAQPLGVGITVKADASNAAKLTQGISSATKLAALLAHESGAMSARIGGLTKQLQERRMQANIKGREIKNIDKQIEIQRKRLEINAKELQVQRLEMEHASETETWYRSKYTNEKLYAWLEGSVRALHYDLYTLASDMCRRAERAFRFERGQQVPTPFLRSGGYWDSSRDGLLAAQQLALDLRRMEAASLNKPAHDWELSKNISLRKVDPRALLMLRETGTATFALPELLFDMDFPGHYMRRLKAVAISIPCIVGPYATLAATLSLVQHTYRVSAAAPTAEDYLNANSSDGSFRTDPLPITAVATSTGIQDSGSFDLGFSQGGGNDARYGPFEGAGAISSWKLELPPVAVQQFDYSTISDVVLHIKYTAVDGGPILKRSVAGAVSQQCKRIENLGDRDGLWGFLEPRNELSNEWYSFKSTLARSDLGQTATLDLGAAIAARLPFWAKEKDVRIETIAIVINGGGADLATQLSLPALGESKWDTTTESVPKRVVLSKNGMSVGVSVKQEDVKWRLSVKTVKGKAYDIKDMAVYFRYVLAQAKSEKK